MALRETLERARSHPATGSEEAVKVRVVLPILDALGWDCTDPSHVDFEYAVGTRRQRGQVDIVLRKPRDANVALIEVKAPGKKLDEFVDQLMEYAFNDSAGICVLTTGLVWWLYLPRADVSPGERRFAQLDVAHDSIEQLIDDFETYLSRPSLLDRSAQQRAQQVLEASLAEERLLSEIPRVWQEMIDEPDHDLVQLVENRVFRSIRLRPTADQIAAVLRGESSVPPPAPVPPIPTRKRSTRKRSTHKRDEEIVRLRNDGVTYREIAEHVGLSAARVSRIYLRETAGRTRQTPPSPLPSSRHSSGPSSQRGKAPRRRVTGFILRGDEHTASSWKDVWLGVAEALYRRHGDHFDHAMQLRGATRQYIARSEEKLFRAQRIGTSPYFAEINFSAGDCERRSRELLELFGYKSDDLEVLGE